MLGLINRSKSWPWRPGQGEILSLTSDLWHSGLCACGSHHEILVTSDSVCFCMQSSMSLKPHPHNREAPFTIFACLRPFHCCLKVRPEINGTVLVSNWDVTHKMNELPFRAKTMTRQIDWLIERTYLIYFSHSFITNANHLKDFFFLFPLFLYSCK